MLCVAIAGVPAFGASLETKTWKKRWIVSAVALTAASLLDFSSSVGKYEVNPMLRDQNGLFSPRRAASFKIGLTAGMVGLQALMMRGRPSAEIEKSATLVNFGTAAVFTGTAVRNWRVAPAQ